MRQSTRPAEEVCSSSLSFHRRLNSYALAASAAGVSFLALAQPSEAKIVYTRTHHVIADAGSYKLDLNHDGVIDLSFQNMFRTVTCTTDGACSYVEQLVTRLAANNEVVYNVFGAVAMKAGMRIGPKRAFHPGLEMMATIGTHSSRGPGGSWINVKNRYLGIKFEINRETHYGWARLSVQVQLPFTLTATLTGYAYETVPNKSIVAGQTIGERKMTAASANPRLGSAYPVRNPPR